MMGAGIEPETSKTVKLPVAVGLANMAGVPMVKVNA